MVRLGLVVGGAELCEAEELGDVEGLELDVLLGVEEGVELGVLAELGLGVDVVGAAVVEFCDVTGAADCEALLVDVGAGAEAVAGLLPLGAWPDRVSGVVLLAPPVTDAVGAVPGVGPPPRRTMTSAVESAAMTAAASTPITHPALPPP